jgi:hypothetical protein
LGRDAALAAGDRGAVDGRRRRYRAEPAEPKTLRDRIARAINATSSENGSNTPDFILAEYLVDCLTAFDKAVTKRGEWYGRMDHPCADRPTVNPSEPPRLAKEGDRVWHPQARKFARVIAVDLRVDEDKALVRYEQVDVKRSELEVVPEHGAK